MVTSPREVVIADTSVLMYLHLLGLTHVLRELYRRVLVPEAVVAELAQGRREGHDLPDPVTISWMDVRLAPTAEDLTSRFPGLDPGEVAVLALAVSQTDGSRFCWMIEKRAKRRAS
jgi:predicted nucleic acid-binding protein